MRRHKECKYVPFSTPSLLCESPSLGSRRIRCPRAAECQCGIGRGNFYVAVFSVASHYYSQKWNSIKWRHEWLEESFFFIYFWFCFSLLGFFSFSTASSLYLTKFLSSLENLLSFFSPLKADWGNINVAFVPSPLPGLPQLSTREGKDELQLPGERILTWDFQLKQQTSVRHTESLLCVINWASCLVSHVL